MEVEHAGQARLRLNLAETSALVFLLPYPKQINYDRPELHPGALGYCCWAPECSRLQGNLRWAKQFAKTWNHDLSKCTTMPENAWKLDTKT